MALKLFCMKLTKEQILKLYYFLNYLCDSNIEIKYFEIMADDIIVRAEPIKGEIENRVWRVTPEGEVIDSPSFFYE